MIYHVALTQNVPFVRKILFVTNVLIFVPRLTQYELPQNHDDDDCRMTLTSSVTRDGSISPNDMGENEQLF